MSYTIPTILNFQQYFIRDFVYGYTSGDLSTVQNQDIQNALNDAGFDFPACLFPNQADFNTGYLLLAAHYMVLSLRTSSQGIAAQFQYPIASKGAGSVNVAYSIPQRLLDNPEFSALTQTPYGAKYLMFVLPQLSGQMFTSPRYTSP